MKTFAPLALVFGFVIYALGPASLAGQSSPRPLPFDAAMYDQLREQRLRRADMLAADSSAGIQALILIRGVEYTRLTPAFQRSPIGLREFLEERGVPVMEVGNTALLAAAAAPSEPDVRSTTVKAMRSDAAKLAAHFSLTDAFVETARAMQIVAPSTAIQIDRKLGWFENISSYASAGLALLGANAFLRGNEEDAGGWAIAASLSTVTNQLLGFIGDKSQARQSSSRVTAALDSAGSYASRIATNVFLTTQLETLGGSTQIIEAHADTVADTSSDPTAQVARERAHMYVLLFGELDNFYDVRLLAIAGELERRADTTNPIYREESKRQMQNLAREIRAAHASWRRARLAYEPSFRAAQEYLRVFGNP